MTLYATGEGPTLPAGIAGKLPAAGKWPAPAANLEIAIGGVKAGIEFQGEVAAGILQVNLKVPAWAPSGSAVPLVLTVEGAAAPASATIAVK